MTFLALAGKCGSAGAKGSRSSASNCWTMPGNTSELATAERRNPRRWQAQLAIVDPGSLVVGPVSVLSHRPISAKLCVNPRAGIRCWPTERGRRPTICLWATRGTRPENALPCRLRRRSAGARARCDRPGGGAIRCLAAQNALGECRGLGVKERIVEEIKCLGRHRRHLPLRRAGVRIGAVEQCEERMARAAAAPSGRRLRLLVS